MSQSEAAGLGLSGTLSKAEMYRQLMEAHAAGSPVAASPAAGSMPVRVDSWLLRIAPTDAFCVQTAAEEIDADEDDNSLSRTLMSLGTRQ